MRQTQLFPERGCNFEVRGRQKEEATSPQLLHALMASHIYVQESPIEKAKCKMLISLAVRC